MADVDSLVEEIHALTSQAKHLNERADELKAELRSQVEVGMEPRAVGNLTLKVSPNKRFNAKKAALILSDEERAQVSETTVSGTKFKALYPDLIDDVSDHYAPRITITEVDR